MSTITSQEPRKPDWLQEMDAQLRRGKHVILYGNVDDGFLGESGNLEPLWIFLERHCRSAGYMRILYYDSVDGLCELQNQGGESPTLNPVVKPLESVIERLRSEEFLAARNNLSAVIFNYSDKLFTDARQQQKNELELVVGLKKCISEAVETEIDAEHLLGRKNAMIIIASQLALPTWFYQEHPLMALIKIPKPTENQRQDYIERIYPIITNRQSSPEQTEIIKSFTDSTYDLTLHDIAAIKRMCQGEKRWGTSPTKMKELVTEYRFGKQENPWEKIGDKINAQDGSAMNKMQQSVVGQDEAIKAIVDMLITAAVGISFYPPTNQSGKPRGVFFFVGPTGVGKTELAKALTKFIFDDERQMKRFDMSEYQQEHAAEKLIGSPPGYVGFEDGGQLTNYVLEKPFSVLLFDEIEKAAPKVLDKFLQILEDGRLTDGKGQTAYFSQSVIIFTSNIGSGNTEPDGKESKSITDKYLTALKAGSTLPYETLHQHYRDEVERYFKSQGRPEIYNRLGSNIVVFDVLREDSIKGIVKIFEGLISKSTNVRRQLNCVFDTSVSNFIVKKMSEGDNFSYGGRRVRALLEDYIEKQLNRWLFDHQVPSGTRSLTLELSESGQLNVRYLQ